MKTTRWLLLLSIALPLIAVPLSAATRTWSGTNSGMWSDPANWDGAVPVDGDDLVFPAGASNTSSTNNNDLPAGMSFHSITIEATYFLQGNAIVLNDGGISSTANDSSTPAGTIVHFKSITVGASQTWAISGSAWLTVDYVVLGGSSLTLNAAGGAFALGPVDGSGAVTVTGGHADLYGSFSGTITNDGGTVTGGVSNASYTQSAGILDISGPVGDVTVNGGIAAVTGRTGNFSLASGATYRETTYSPCECVIAVPTVVTGTVNLGGATLASPSHGVIIENDGTDPVVGTFAGLPEGAGIEPQHVAITYVGGDGNDVEIKTLPARTTTTLTSSANPSQLGEAVAFTAVVNSPALGTVTFYDGDTPLATIPLSVGPPPQYLLNAIFTESLSLGSHSMTARYNGPSWVEPSTSQLLIQIVGPAPPPSPEVTFTATPSNIAPANSSTLTWSTANATSVMIDPGLGAQPLSGSLTVQPAETTTYTLTANGPGGTTVQQVIVTVSSGPSITFIASPSMIGVGHLTTLSWSVADATSVSIDHGIGPQPNAASIEVAPESTTLYSLTATGPAGTMKSSVTVTVVPMPEITFTATPQSILPGTLVTLRWSTTNATSVFIDHGVGFVEAVGSLVVEPMTTTTYTMTATGLAGTTPATTTIKVAGRIRAVRH
jgi:hypothetical protein